MIPNLWKSDIMHLPDTINLVANDYFENLLVQLYIMHISVIICDYCVELVDENLGGLGNMIMINDLIASGFNNTNLLSESIMASAHLKWTKLVRCCAKYAIRQSNNWCEIQPLFLIHE